MKEQQTASTGRKKRLPKLIFS